MHEGIIGRRSQSKPGPARFSVCVSATTGTPLINPGKTSSGQNTKGGLGLDVNRSFTNDLMMPNHKGGGGGGGRGAKLLCPLVPLVHQSQSDRGTSICKANEALTNQIHAYIKYLLTSNVLQMIVYNQLLRWTTGMNTLQCHSSLVFSLC